MKYQKVVVAVDAHFNTDGNVVPKSITWNNGNIYIIDRVLSQRKAASLKAGGIGIRYTVRIQGKERFLWYEEPVWFVEAPKA